jgi:hypothetical protein
MPSLWPLIARKPKTVSPLDLRIKSLRSLEEFRASYAAGNPDLGPGSWAAPVTTESRFDVPGYCFVDQRYVAFEMDDLYASRCDGKVAYNWRERMTCPACGLNNRHRGAIHVFQALLHPSFRSRIWLTEKLSPLYKVLNPRYPSLVGSEFLGDDKESGWVSPIGVRHEDITNCSFPDQTLDAVLSFDVLEHVPDPEVAFRETYRVLAPGAALLFSVPFLFWDYESRIRSRRLADGTIEHILPPQYHSDPFNSADGILVYRDFGWDVIDQLKAAGFSDAYCAMYQSVDYGYVGDPQVIFVATKS